LQHLEEGNSYEYILLYPDSLRGYGATELWLTLWFPTLERLHIKENGGPKETVCDPVQMSV